MSQLSEMQLYILHFATLALAADLSQYICVPSKAISGLEVNELPQVISPQRYPIGRCKAFAGDESWPSEQDWTALNATLNGALIKPVPRGGVCHSSWPQYNGDECSKLIANWNQFEQRQVYHTITENSINTHTPAWRTQQISYIHTSYPSAAYSRHRLLAYHITQ